MFWVVLKVKGERVKVKGGAGSIMFLGVLKVKGERVKVKGGVRVDHVLGLNSRL